MDFVTQLFCSFRYFLAREQNHMRFCINFFCSFFWRKICHGNLALTKWIVKNDDFLLFIFIFLQKRTKERSNKINFILFVVEAKRKVANFLVRRARPKTDFRQPKIFPGENGQKGGFWALFGSILANPQRVTTNKRKWKKWGFEAENDGYLLWSVIFSVGFGADSGGYLLWSVICFVGFGADCGVYFL